MNSSCYSLKKKELCLNNRRESSNCLGPFLMIFLPEYNTCTLQGHTKRFVANGTIGRLIKIIGWKLPYLLDFGSGLVSMKRLNITPP